MSNDVRKHQLTLLFFGLLLMTLGLYGLGLGLSILPAEFTATIIIVFGTMLAVGTTLYFKVIIESHRKWFFGYLLIVLGLDGLVLGTLILPAEFTATIIIVFGTMLAVGTTLYFKVIIESHRKRKI